MTYEVQQTRWDRIIRRVSGSIGPGSRVSETISELFPMIDIERVPGELLVLGGTRLSWGSAFVAAVVAESPKVQLFNPADSASLVTITQVTISANTAGIVRYTMESSARPDAVSSERFRESRLGILPTPVAEVRSDSSALLLPAIGRLHLEQNVTFSLRDDNGICVLAPDAGLVFGSENNNVALTVHFFWRERPAEQSELNLGG